jgi:hypothetical protein
VTIHTIILNRPKATKSPNTDPPGTFLIDFSQANPVTTFEQFHFLTNKSPNRIKNGYSPKWRKPHTNTTYLHRSTLPPSTTYIIRNQKPETNHGNATQRSIQPIVRSHDTVSTEWFKSCLLSVYGNAMLPGSGKSRAEDWEGEGVRHRIRPL